jgi:uncharacterized damage-inducible protein DinB
MLPPLIADAFRSGPTDLIAVCRPHSWDELTAAPAAGLRSIRDILVHLMDNEAGWLGLVRGEGRRKLDPADFGSLDDILAAWLPLREASVALILALTPEERQARRSLPWNPTATVSVEEIVWHVVGHEQYHRGQEFTRLALLGRRDLPDLDLIRATR